MTEKIQKKFDASKPVKLQAISPDGIKEILLKFPTDEQMLKRLTWRKLIIDPTIQGSDGAQIEESGEEELQLLAELHEGPLPDWMDATQASKLLDALQFAELTNGEIIQGSQLCVQMLVPGAQVTHIFRMPTAKESDQYEKKLFDRRPYGRNKTSSVRNLPFLAALYDKMQVSADGYAGEVPIAHKADAVFLAFVALTDEIDPKQNFFRQLNGVAS